MFILFFFDFFFFFFPLVILWCARQGWLMIFECHKKFNKIFNFQSFLKIQIAIYRCAIHSSNPMFGFFIFVFYIFFFYGTKCMDSMWIFTVARIKNTSQKKRKKKLKKTKIKKPNIGFDE